MGCIGPEGNSQEGRGQVDGEDIVGIGEETNTGNDDGTHMVPAKGRLVNLGQGETTSLVGVLDVSKVIVAGSNAGQSCGSTCVRSTRASYKLWKAALPPAVF